MRKIAIGLTAFMVLLISPIISCAYDLGSVQINGFLSQGYLDSGDNNFLANSKTGTAQFNEVGLTFTTRINEELRLGAQLLSRDLGDVGNNEVKLDWGFADYHYSDYAGLRLGKVKLPLGLYNEGRDSDFLRPMVFLPQSIYDETKRDLLVAYQGAGVYGNLPLGPIGDVDYHGYYGSINFSDDALLYDALKQNGTLSLRTNLVQTYAPIVGQPTAASYASTLSITNLDIENDYIAGGSLILNTALDGLRFGFSYLKVKNDLAFTVNKSLDPTNTSLSPGVLEGSLENKSTFVGSAEYILGNWMFAGEYSETDRTQTYNGLVGTDATSQSYYGLIAYTFFDKLTLSALYDVYYSDKDDKDGTAFVAASPSGRKDFFTWRKDFGIGVRYDVNPNWTLKAEYHAIDGAGLFMTVVNDPADLEKNWDYYALKASFNF